MSTCERVAPLVGARPGELSPEELEELAQHLAACPACASFAADVAALDGLVADGISRAAARRDFSAFSDGVMARIPAGAWRAPTGSGVERAGLWSWVRHHRLLAAASAVVPALAALALYLYIGAARPAGPAIEVNSGELAAVVLDTADGPVILVGEDSGGT